MISRKRKVETDTSCSMFIHVLHVSCHCHFLCHQRHHDFISWHLRGLSHSLFGAEGREILGHAHAEPQQWREEDLSSLLWWVFGCFAWMMGDWSFLFLGQCAQECNRFNRYQILIVAMALFSFIFCRFFLPHIAEGLLKDLLRLAMVQESRLETTSRAVNSPGLQQCSVCPVLFLQSTTSEKRIEILHEEGDQAHNVRIRNPKLSDASKWCEVYPSSNENPQHSICSSICWGSSQFHNISQINQNS